MIWALFQLDPRRSGSGTYSRQASVRPPKGDVPAAHSTQRFSTLRDARYLLPLSLSVAWNVSVATARSGPSNSYGFRVDHCRLTVVKVARFQAFANSLYMCPRAGDRLLTATWTDRGAQYMGGGGEGKKAYDEDQRMIREGAESLSRAADVRNNDE